MEKDMHGLRRDLDAAPGDLSSDDYAARLTTLQAAAAAFNAARAADPRAAAEGLRATHAALAYALKTHRGNHVAVYKAASDFAAAAKALGAVVAPPGETPA
jgi:hypothetical protein